MYIRTVDDAVSVFVVFLELLNVPGEPGAERVAHLRIYCAINRWLTCEYTMLLIWSLTDMIIPRSHIVLLC